VFYVAYLLQLPFTPNHLYVLYGLLIVINNFFQSMNAEETAPNSIHIPSRIEVLTLGLALALIAIGSVRQNVLINTRDSLDTDIAVISFNLQNGFGPTGTPEIIQQVDLINQSGGTLVGLQEVSRGWLVNGSFDMYSFLKETLDYPYSVFGPSADHHWGIALFSKFPIEDEEYVSLPTENNAMGRGFIFANIKTPNGEIEIISTHLHHLADDPGIHLRQIQIAAILEYSSSRNVGIIFGDLNAGISSSEIELFLENGWSSSYLEKGEGTGFTFPFREFTSPFKADWILYSNILEISDYRLYTDALSDHLPIFASFEFNKLSE
jgi:endonuclease/exonuclease/phosphatase family metal-dependent hydrolase